MEGAYLLIYHIPKLLESLKKNLELGLGMMNSLKKLVNFLSCWGMGETIDI